MSHMQWIDLGRTSTRYERVGDRGPLLVLIHEMGGSLESWDGVCDMLRAEFRLLRYDMRGAGQAEKVGAPMTFDDLADDLLVLLDALGLSEPAHIAGCAVGAGVAVTFGERHPSRVAKLVLINPALGIPPEARASRHARVDSIVKNGMRGAVATSLDSGYPPQMRGDKAVFETFRARWITNDPVSFGFMFRMLIDGSVEGRLPALACPVLVVSGQYDGVRPPEQSARVAAMIKSAQLKVVPSAHHMPTQSPKILADLFREFVIHEVASNAAP
jgi:3-oxoadipate enol-lactonase